MVFIQITTRDGYNDNLIKPIIISAYNLLSLSNRVGIYLDENRKDEDHLDDDEFEEIKNIIINSIKNTENSELIDSPELNCMYYGNIIDEYETKPETPKCVKNLLDMRTYKESIVFGADYFLYQDKIECYAFVEDKKRLLKTIKDEYKK